ncbi:MAG TPA: DUF4260 domain-containing protein [Rhizomicrobium sp.]|jgi:hypothetical protein|nr:DUF4260 domain-containing protein [Rhizomicrobium sp.]
MALIEMTVETKARDGVRDVLRMEGLALAAASVAAYAHMGGSWAMFASFILAPDAAFLAYLAGPRFGALGYNVLHSTIGAILLGFVGVLLAQHAVILVALIWAAHIGFDRAMGYGLKYASGFRDTHLNSIGHAH